MGGIVPPDTTPRILIASVLVGEAWSRHVTYSRDRPTATAQAGLVIELDGGRVSSCRVE